jgi:hypothetical protein
VPAPARAATPASEPGPNPQADARRDYELALQIGNRAAFGAFLAQYPDGFYASLAKLQLEKIAAEDARVAATEKARQTEQERARLAAEGAKKEAQAKAEADAKAAEQARVAAEKAKQVAQDQAAAAERNRTDKASDTRITASNAATGSDSRATSPSTPDKAANVAALTPGSSQADITKSVQLELRRVGCLAGAADGDWNAESQRSLSSFNRNAGMKLDVKAASADTLDAIKQKQSRVCPLVCEHGYKADGDRCTRIACADGSFLNDDNECETRRGKTPTAKRDRPEARQIPEARQFPQAKQAIVRRSQTPTGPGLSSTGRPLTGSERAVGCNSYQAIMSGVCP